ncbi:ATP-binding protein [Streptomyces sp. NPDC029216]|uniref:ATP-binding protein n=1 Tax=Streptomyces sp. NPDC029216 TaxID=3154701 RepID=UPI0033FD9232
MSGVSGVSGVDEFWLLAQELRGAREQAHETLVRLAVPAAPSDSDRKVEVFVNLARRLQSLVHREISLLDELEDTVEDPDLLRQLFHVDHLATRIRRHAENLAVLGGAASRRQWTRPIDLSEVLRSSVAEVEQYTRVKVVPPAGGTVRGHAVADVVHLLAELVENATVFSAPDTDVVVRAERVTAGIAVEVEDRGLGMPPREQSRMNTLLGDPDQVSVRHLLADGRIGLFVVSALARRHGIAVELKSNIYGGVLAVLVLPQGLLGAESPNAADALSGSRPTSWGTAEPTPLPPLEPARLPDPTSPPPERPAPDAEEPRDAGWGLTPARPVDRERPLTPGRARMAEAHDTAGAARPLDRDRPADPERGPAPAGFAEAAASDSGWGLAPQPVGRERPLAPGRIPGPARIAEADDTAGAAPARRLDRGRSTEPERSPDSAGFTNAGESRGSGWGLAPQPVGRERPLAPSRIPGPARTAEADDTADPGWSPGPLRSLDRGRPADPVRSPGPAGTAGADGASDAGRGLGPAPSPDRGRSSEPARPLPSGWSQEGGWSQDPGRSLDLGRAPAPGGAPEPVRPPAPGGAPAAARTADPARALDLGRTPSLDDDPARPPGLGRVPAPGRPRITDTDWTTDAGLATNLGRASETDRASGADRATGLDRPSDAGLATDYGRVTDAGLATDLGRVADAGLATDFDRAADADRPTALDGPTALDRASGLGRSFDEVWSADPGRSPSPARGAVPGGVPGPAVPGLEQASGPASAWARGVGDGYPGPLPRRGGERPPLPRRRAQTHLAPQLCEAPAPRRADGGTEQAVHDPGLMAAFQRGFGLAQSEQQTRTHE